jgi:drug/metabolite transporter (DMT)-like permease
MAVVGHLLCLLSGAAFGAMAIFGKLAYDEGIGVSDLLLTRFAMAALVLVALAYVTGALRGLARPAVLAGLALGAIGYATQAGLYFLALERMDASVLALILYTYPALVTVAAIVLGRERVNGRRIVAVGIASGGTVLVLAGAGTGALDPLGTILGAGAALAYTTYILMGDRMRGVPPLALAALVTAGATATFAVTAVVTGGPDLGFDAAGWGWIAAIALISTVVAVLAFFAGMERVGPSTASILSTFEPVVTIGLAAAVFGEALTALQGIGAAFVLGAVLVLAGPVRARIRRFVPAPAGS